MMRDPKTGKTIYHTGKSNEGRLNNLLKDIDERLNELEYKTQRMKKAPTVTRAQKMLLMEHLGILDAFRALNISNKKVAKLIHYLIDTSPDNIEGDLSEILNPKSTLKTKDNYKFLFKAFREAKLEKLEVQVNTELENLE